MCLAVVSLKLTCVFCISIGLAGGSFYSKEGGGANHLCLRNNPVFRPTDELRSVRAEVYGAEYNDPPKPLLHDHDVPCAVCLVTRSVVLMMPGTNLCNEGWTTEYVGQISTARTHDSYHRTEFICMDDDAEKSLYSSPDNDNGAIFVPAQVICGSLPCTPYVEDKDLLCVVCSR